MLVASAVSIAQGIVAAFFILWGLIVLLAPGLLWRMHTWSKRVEGVVGVERTREWDMMRTIGGVLMLLGGLALLVMDFSGKASSSADDLRLRRAPKGVQELPPEWRPPSKERDAATEANDR